MEGRNWYDEYYEPLWATAADAGVCVTFHRTFGGAPPDADWDELARTPLCTDDGMFSVVAIVP